MKKIQVSHLSFCIWHKQPGVKDFLFTILFFFRWGSLTDLVCLKRGTGEINVGVKHKKRANDKANFRERDFLSFLVIFYVWNRCSLVLIFKRQLFYLRHKPEEEASYPVKLKPGGWMKEQKLREGEGRIKDPWRAHTRPKAAKALCYYVSTDRTGKPAREDKDKGRGVSRAEKKIPGQ